MYYKDENGVYTRPWVRVHATKDYLDMAEMIAAEEGVKATEALLTHSDENVRIAAFRSLRRVNLIIASSPNYIESSPFLRPLKAKCEAVPLGIPLEPFDIGRFARQDDPSNDKRETHPA